MIFNSITFLVFLVVVVVLFWLLPKRAGLWMIAISSLVFYGFWKPEYTLLLIFAAVMDYYIALAIDRQQDPARRKRLLVVSLVFNLGILFYFKYLLFFTGNIEYLLNAAGAHVALMPTLQIILPIGISFYTFETISYTVDVYRKHLKPEKNFVSYLSFLVYFPHLIAGPILRASDILPQFDNKQRFNWDLIVEGFKRILYGLFLKVAVADNISPFVDQAFAMQVSAVSAIDIWTMAFLFGFQIYFDFSAYSHIAIGCARLMGITFFENFNFPYMAVSPRAFWKRWHISLSNWIKDYLYIPLTGQKVVVGKQQAISEIRSDRNLKSYVALFLTWAIMGFWHGASWTFVIWGIYHALLVAIHRAVGKLTVTWNRSFLNIGGWLISLPFLMLGWIPFRVTDLSLVKDYFLRIVDPAAYSFLGLRENVYLVTFLLLVCIILAYITDRYLKDFIRETWVGYFTRLAAMSVMVALVVVFLRPVSQFIYFQF